MRASWNELLAWQIQMLEAIIPAISDRLALYDEQHTPEADDEPADLTPRQKHYVRFWTELGEYLREHGGPKLMKAQPQNWMNIHIGRTGIRLGVAASAWDGEQEQYGEWHNRVEFLIDHPDSHLLFQQIENRRAEIEAALAPERVIFDSREGVRMCKVYVKQQSNIQDEDSWPQQFEWICRQLIAFDQLFRPIAAELGTDAVEAAREPMQDAH